MHTQMQMQMQRLVIAAALALGVMAATGTGTGTDLAGEMGSAADVAAHLAEGQLVVQRVNASRDRSAWGMMARFVGRDTRSCYEKVFAELLAGDAKTCTTMSEEQKRHVEYQLMGCVLDDMGQRVLRCYDAATRRATCFDSANSKPTDQGDLRQNTAYAIARGNLTAMCFYYEYASRCSTAHSQVAELLEPFLAYRDCKERDGELSAELLRASEGRRAADAAFAEERAAMTVSATRLAANLSRAQEKLEELQEKLDHLRGGWWSRTASWLRGGAWMLIDPKFRELLPSRLADDLYNMIKLNDTDVLISAMKTGLFAFVEHSSVIIPQLCTAWVCVSSALRFAYRSVRK